MTLPTIPEMEAERESINNRLLTEKLPHSRKKKLKERELQLKKQIKQKRKSIKRQLKKKTNEKAKNITTKQKEMIDRRICERIRNERCQHFRSIVSHECSKLVRQSTYFGSDDVLEKLDSGQIQVLRNFVTEFVNKLVDDFASYTSYVSPGYRNPIVMAHQTLQPIRIVFGLDVESDSCGKSTDSHGHTFRVNYAPLAIIRSSGYHPDDYCVYPLPKSLKLAMDSLVKSLIEGNPFFSNFDLQVLNLNSLELKLYLGQDVFTDEDGNPLVDGDNKKLNTNRNRRITAHTDFDYDENGQQSENDTGDGSNPIATLTFGAEREYTTFFVKKEANNKESKWEPVKGTEKITTLEDCSVNMLNGEDEKPYRQGPNCYKIKHKAYFKKKDGVSIGMVLRCVKENNTGKFTASNKWLWREDLNDVLRKKVQKKIDSDTAVEIKKKDDLLHKMKNGKDISVIGEKIKTAIMTSKLFQDFRC